MGASAPSYIWKRIKNLKVSLEDNQKGRVLLPNGKYAFNHPVFNEEKVNLQEYYMNSVSGKTHKVVKREKLSKASN